MKKMRIILLQLMFFLLFIGISKSNADTLKKIVIEGNQRISSDTIKLFSDLKLDQNIDNKLINKTLKTYMKQIFLKTFLYHLIIL